MVYIGRANLTFKGSCCVAECSSMQYATNKLTGNFKKTRLLMRLELLMSRLCQLEIVKIANIFRVNLQRNTKQFTFD